VAELELTPGVLEYEDTGGAAPVIVLLHGLLMTGALWDEVVEELRPGFRCIRPTLPMGAHRRAMSAEADLSLRGQVRLLVEFLERLDLNQVTLVFNDWCGAQLLVAERRDARVERLVLASCETYDNYPPGLPGRTAALAAALPGGLNAALKPLRLKAHVLRHRASDSRWLRRTLRGPHHHVAARHSIWTGRVASLTRSRAPGRRGRRPAPAPRPLAGGARRRPRARR
jgi:pimeloyl-ACP methyl ester carboxylesterase